MAPPPPGGPTDPDPPDPSKPLEAVQNGATWDESTNALATSNGTRWLRVDGDAWELADTSSGACQVERATVDDLAVAELAAGNRLRVGSALRALVPVGGWARLV